MALHSQVNQLFSQSRGSAGSHSILGMLRKEGVTIGRFRVRRLMRELGLFRSLKSEWIPATGDLTAQETQRDISHYLMYSYNWIRPHQFNDGLPPPVAEEKLNPLSGIG